MIKVGLHLTRMEQEGENRNTGSRSRCYWHGAMVPLVRVDKKLQDYKSGDGGKVTSS